MKRTFDLYREVAAISLFNYSRAPVRVTHHETFRIGLTVGTLRAQTTGLPQLWTCMEIPDKSNQCKLPTPEHHTRQHVL